MTAYTSEIHSTFVNEVSPRLLVDSLNHSHKDLMKKAKAVYVYFDTFNIADWEFVEKDKLKLNCVKKAPIKYISFRPLMIRVLIGKQLQRLQSEEWYSQQFQAGQRIYIPLNQERQLCKDERINILRIDCENLREYKGHYFYHSIIIPVKFDAERSLMKKADQIIEDEFPLAKVDFMLYLDARPESIRQQKHGYIDKIRREINKQYQTNINYKNAQKWIHEFRKEQPETKLTLMDRYKHTYTPKSDRKYYLETDKCSLGLYVHNHQQNEQK